MQYTLQSIDIRSASLEFIKAFNQFNNTIRAEKLPDDPPVPLDETIQSFRNLPDFISLKGWAVLNDDSTQLIAWGDLVLENLKENRHMAEFDVRILPDFRLHGLGSRLLAAITQEAKADNRQLLVTETVDRVLAGSAFMTRVGAKEVLVGHINQLVTEKLDEGLLAAWINNGQNNSAQFTLGFWDGAYPEEKINDVIRLYELENQQPRGTLDVEDIHMTAEKLRQLEKHVFAKGYQRWTCFLMEKLSGNFAGYTEVLWNPNRPTLLSQEMTGVFPEYRNKGLGRWLKAVMLARVLKERKEVKFIRTGNADSNVAMLKINQELGFKPYMAESLWQLEIGQAQQYLNQRDKP